MKRTPRRERWENVHTQIQTDLVLNWLNGSVPDHFAGPGVFYRPSIGSQARIERVFSLLTQIQTVDAGEIPVLIDTLNGILARYPTVFFWSTLTTRLYGGRGALVRVPTGQRWDVHEAYVIEGIVDLAAAHLLDKIVQCPCSRWYFKKKSDHTSCSIACRKKKHETTPEYKVAKADRARRNRLVRERKGMGTKTPRRSQIVKRSSR